MRILLLVTITAVLAAGAASAPAAPFSDAQLVTEGKKLLEADRFLQKRVDTPLRRSPSDWDAAAEWGRRMQEHGASARTKLAKIAPSTANGRKARTALSNYFKWKAALGGAVVGVRNALAQGNGTNASILGEQAELDFKLAQAEYLKAVRFLPGLRI